MGDVIGLEGGRLAMENEQLRADLALAREQAAGWKAQRDRAALDVERLRSWRTPPSPSAKPDSLEKCHALIEYLDVEISGAVQDYLQTKAKLRRYEEREELVNQLLEACGAYDVKQPGNVYAGLAQETAELIREFDLNPKDAK